MGQFLKGMKQADTTTGDTEQGPQGAELAGQQAACASRSHPTDVHTWLGLQGLSATGSRGCGKDCLLGQNRVTGAQSGVCRSRLRRVSGSGSERALSVSSLSSVLALVLSKQQVKGRKKRLWSQRVKCEF